MEGDVEVNYNQVKESESKMNEEVRKIRKISLGLSIGRNLRLGLGLS